VDLFFRRSIGAGNEVEPQTTFRGHTAPVTSLAVSSKGMVFSGSLDATIRVWRVPSAQHETYSAYDPSLTVDSLIGHTDGVWDVALLPSRGDPEGFLVSAGADGAVKVWDATKADINGKGYPLLRTWTYDGADSGSASSDVEPVSIAPYFPDLQNVLIGYNNGVVKAFSLATGKVIKTFGQQEKSKNRLSATGDQTADIFHPDLSACNQVICHHTLDVIVSAHDDGNLRFYDSKTGESSLHKDEIYRLDR
jgi:striatin 1/3/4